MRLIKTNSRIDLAVGLYPNGRTFNHPWKFEVHDNFLSDGLAQYLLSLKLTPPNKNMKGEDMKINETLIHGIRVQAEQKLNIVEDLWFRVGLHHAAPDNKYPWHEDSIRKKHSCVVYLGNNGTGTILGHPQELRDEYEVLWRDNRALYFQREDKLSWHRFESGGKPRLTLNMYWMTDNFRINTKQDMKYKQLHYMTLPPRQK